MPTCVVTTSQKAASVPRAECEAWAERLQTRFVPRRRRPLSRLCRDEGVEGALVLSSDRPPTYVSGDGTVHYYYHPGMALTRIRNLQQGLGDPMVTAMELAAGDRVLDCTLGRGADALVASHVVGERGRVVGIESSLVLGELTIHGLRTYRPSREAFAPLFRRIEALRGDHLELLRAAPDKAFDVVAFDPLFEEPVAASSGMAPLRPLADHRPVSDDALTEALRVAARCVVIKERAEAALWDRLKVDRLVAGKASSIAYGVLRRGD